MQSDDIYMSVGIVGLLCVRARQCTTTPSLPNGYRKTPDFMSPCCLVLTQ